MTTLSAEPVSVGANGELLRLGDEVVYLRAVWRLVSIDPNQRWPQYNDLRLEPVDRAARSYLKREQGPKARHAIAYAWSVRRAGTSDVSIEEWL